MIIMNNLRSLFDGNPDMLGWFNLFATVLIVFKTSRHAKNLEIIKSDLEIEKFRTDKAQIIDFKILPMIWEKLMTLLGHLEHVTSWLSETSDISKMDDKAISDFLSKLNFTQPMVQEVLTSAKRQSTFVSLKNQLHLIEIQKQADEFHNYYIIKRPFLTDELTRELGDLDSFVSKLISSWTTGEIYDDPKIKSKSYEEFSKNAKPLADRIEKLIRNRVFSKS